MAELGVFVNCTSIESLFDRGIGIGIREAGLRLVYATLWHESSSANT